MPCGPCIERGYFEVSALKSMRPTADLSPTKSQSSDGRQMRTNLSILGHYCCFSPSNAESGWAMIFPTGAVNPRSASISSVNSVMTALSRNLSTLIV